MPRRSKRLSERDMSAEEENSPIASPVESDSEKTMIESKEPSIAELKDEILALKRTLSEYVSSTSSSAEMPTEKKMPVVTTIADALPGTSTSNVTTEPAATASMQHKLDACEYSMPFQYNLPKPFTAARSFAPTTTCVPYSAAQQIVPTSMPYSAAQQILPTSMPYSVTQQIVPTSMPYSATHSYVPTTTTVPFFPTSVENLRFTQDNTSAQTGTTPVTTNLPPYVTSAPPHVPGLQPANECRQLRKLHDLPHFSGQPEQWPMFIVAYRETTLNYNYSNLENLIRLQKCLKGDAKAKVESFLIHPDTFSHVISALEFHYGRPQVLIRSQIAKVRAFPPISEKKIYDILNFNTMVSNLAAFLINANATTHLSNPTLLDELINKLPFQKREELMKHSVNNVGPYPSVHDFSLWLQEVTTYVSLSQVSYVPTKSSVV